MVPHPRRRPARALFFLATGGLALAGCAKPADPWAKAGSADAMVAAGWRDYADGAFDTANADFTRAAKMAGSNADERQAALYGKGMVWALRRPGEDPARAAGFYEAALQAAPRGTLAPWSLLALARLRHLAASGDADQPAVREAYQRVVTAYPDHPAGEEAFLFQQTTLLLQRDAAEAGSALEALTRFIEGHPHSPLASTAWGLIARAHGILGQPAEQLAAHLHVLDTSEAAPGDPATDQAATLWGLAMEAEFDVGDFATARRLLQRLLKDYPTDSRGYGAHLALERMDAVEVRLRAGASIAEVRRELDPARP